MKTRLIPLLALSLLLTLGAYGQPAGPGGPPTDNPQQPGTNPTEPPMAPPTEPEVPEVPETPEPTPPGETVPGIPEEVLTLRDDLQQMHQNLDQSRREAILALGDNPSDEAVRTALETWRSENAADLEDLEGMAESYRNALRESRPDRPEGPPSESVANRRQAARANIASMRSERAALGDQLGNPDLSPGEREALVQEFRDSQRALAAERSNLERQSRADEAGAGPGERRPGG